jgi:hypothetical protein
MNYTLCNTFPIPLFTNHEKPCVTLYMPTHPSITNRKKDILVFKNLIKRIELSLETMYSTKDVIELISKLKDLENDVRLWDHTQYGFVLFADINEVMIYIIQKEVKELAIVSNSFHVKPLYEYFQSIETFHILALDNDAFAIYKADIHTIQKIQLPNTVKTTLTEVLGSDHTESYLTHGTYGGASNHSIFHGHGGKSDDKDIDRIKFFRHVDSQVLEHISKPSEFPLILLAQKSIQHDFKHLSQNSYLIDSAIDGSMKDFSESDVLNYLKVIQDSRFDSMMEDIFNQYNSKIQYESSSDQIIIILKAIIESRVHVLMIEKNKMIPGKIDYEKGQIIQKELNDPDTDDLLDDMIEYALTKGTKCYILEKEKMPTTSGVAAIFRY